MAQKFYEIGYMVQASPEEYDFETVEWECDYERVEDARKRARELSKKCPFKYNNRGDIVAIQITCHAEIEGVTTYWIYWTETYINGKMIRRTNY